MRENLLFAPNRRCIHLRRAFASVALQEKYNSTLPSDFALGDVALILCATTSALQYARKYFAGIVLRSVLSVREEERLIVAL